MAITFPVSPVPRAIAALHIPASPGLRLQDGPVEAMGASVAPFLPADAHGLLRAAHVAYALHYPLVLSPDTVWLAIAQGFAVHVNENAERLRGKLVRHAGQETIEIRRDDFVKGLPENPWPEVFAAFSAAIAEHIGRQRDLVVADFSTTGPCERAASEIVLLDAMQRYFRYEVHTLCGIPEITLDGTPDDWRSIRRRARALEEYDLGWWTRALGPVLNRIVDTAEGRVDGPFWETFFKHVDGSGGPWVTGWINVLFPYLRAGKQGALDRNPSLRTWEQGVTRGYGGGPAPASIPSGLSCAPFDWCCYERRFSMQLIGGFVGVAQDPGTLALRPVIGWAVRDAPAAVPARSVPAQVRARPLPEEATLIAGRVSDAMSLTPFELTALVARVEDLLQGASPAAGVRVAVAGDFSSARDFPEAPVACRIAAGVPIGAVDSGTRRFFGIAALRCALAESEALPESLWRTLAGALPGRLGGGPALHLVVSGRHLRGEVRFDSVLATEVTTGGTPATTVDVSAGAHDARVAAAQAPGAEPGDGLYALAVDAHWTSPPR
jgi:Domain of unknown function (DUF4419)